MCASVEMLSKFCAAKFSSEIFPSFCLKTCGVAPPREFSNPEFPVNIGGTLHGTLPVLRFTFAQAIL